MSGENKGWMRAEQDRRRSSVAQRHRNKTRYHRPDAKREVEEETDSEPESS